MKLLRDFFRFRSTGGFPLAGRRQSVRPNFTVTVPQPLEKAGDRVPAMDRSHELPLADVPRTSRHLHLVSSH